MNIFKKSSTLWVTVLICTSASAFSQQTQVKEVLEDNGAAYANCDVSTLIAIPTVFSDIKDEAIKLTKTECEYALSKAVGEPKFTPEDIQLMREQFAQDTSKKVQTVFTDVKDFDVFIEHWTSLVAKGKQANLSYSSDLMSGTTIKLSSRWLNPNASASLKSELNCKNYTYNNQPAGFSSCSHAGKDFTTTLNIPHTFSKYNQLSKVSDHVTSIATNWQSFVDNSRFQTSLDVLATTLFYSDNWKRADLQGPPPIQYFALHPSMVYSYMKDGTRGDEMKLSPAVEWFGMNWWNNKTIPLGFSITSVYNNRPIGKKFLSGLSLHIDNNYTFGVVGTGDDRTFYVNIDLMAWFTDKKGKYNKYKGEFKKYKS
jgi:hypothetical protein